MKILIIGDVVAKPGRKVLAEKLESIKQEFEIEFTVANIENAASGAGVNQSVGEEILKCGVDVMTSGNHVFDRKEAAHYIENEKRLLRPLNYAPDSPGRGLWLGATSSGTPIAVFNVQGRVFMPPTDCPFRAADKAIEDIAGRASIIIVDHHAEATSEKLAMGRYLDGRVTVVVGTHTHVQTADEQIMPGGTAYITDMGMTGPHSGIIGVRSELVLTRFVKGMPARFETATDDIRLNGVVVEADERTGRATSITRLRTPLNGESADVRQDD